MIVTSANLFDYPIVVAYTENMPHDVWIKFRKNYIGGSEAYASMGLGSGKYASRISVYYDKTSDIMEQADNERMWAGRMLEPVIAQMFMEKTGKTVVKQPFWFQHPEYEFMAANIDFGIPGENAGLECKNSAARKLWENGLPESYFVQCQHYMAVTGADRWYLAYLLDGWEFNFVCVERDDALIERMIYYEERLWYDHIVPRIPPEYDGSESSRRVLNALYPMENEGMAIDLNDELDEWMGRAETLGIRIKELTQEKDAITHKICGLMGEHELGYTRGHIFKYKTVAPAGKKPYRRLFITVREE